jgi:maltooligosyltrehalose trehalohydrolase
MDSVTNQPVYRQSQAADRRLPVGAEPTSRGTHFRVWAPRCRSVEVVLDPSQRTPPGQSGLAVSLESEEGGYFSGMATMAHAGDLYSCRLDGGKTLFPDPASRFQPHGPSGPSQIIAPEDFSWTDKSWPGAALKGQVLYELHVGTFTQAGTWAAAESELVTLADLGITLIEVMPVAEFPGTFGWGYDGVSLFAPAHVYGTPDDFRRFVNSAHACGIGVILDVVYNHFGPDGCYLREFSQDYFSSRYQNEWGDPLNFDGPGAGPVREFFLANTRYWIEEFHLDGLRLDATQQMFDASAEHILASISKEANKAANGRAIVLVAENEPQDVRLVQSVDQGGYGLDALWNDDFHHSAMVALTGHNEAYYTDYLGNPQEFISAVKYGYLYQGQWYRWQRSRRGTPGLKIAPATFINFLQNHDQVANSGLGLRCHLLTSPGRYKALTALLLLMPGTPMLFQGQEFAASAPFLYFADHRPDLAKQVSRGRAEFLAQFRRLALPDTQRKLPEPADQQTFLSCKLDLSERGRNAQIYKLHCDLLRLRRDDPVFHAQRPRGVDGAVLAAQAFVLRIFAEQEEDDRLLIVNLGRDVHLNPAPEPLLAPPLGKQWCVRWSTEAIEYGGCGTPPPDSEENWRIPGEAAVVLISEPRREG